MSFRAWLGGLGEDLAVDPGVALLVLVPVLRIKQLQCLILVVFINCRHCRRNPSHTVKNRTAKM